MGSVTEVEHKKFSRSLTFPKKIFGRARSILSKQMFGMMPQMIVNKGGDEVVTVVVTVLNPELQINGDTGGACGLLVRG